MRTDKERALELRKLHLSYKDIQSKLKIPKSTLSDWLGKEEWSKNIKAMLSKSSVETSRSRLIELNNIRGIRLNEAYNSARIEAVAEFQNYKYNPLFIAGLMIYWGEGDKRTKGNTKLTNTDPEMLKLFVMFLTRVLCIPISRIKASLLYYEDLNEKECRGYWAECIGLPIDNFSKSTLILGRHKVKRTRSGICMVCVSSTYLKEKMNVWLKKLPNELMNKEYYENMQQVAGMVQW